ncbi:hypothetical protein [Hydrogenophaga sp. 5NK40-0174]|uniref:hypothetical protein n=1 Tax=Hydrogenophaga sp. 5NK40-0174 TaxID=3127649 RepID=UPI003106C961
MARELNDQQTAVIDWLNQVRRDGGVDRYPGGFEAFKADLFDRLDGLSTRVPDQAADAVTLLYSGNAGNVQGNWQLAESIGTDSHGRVVTIGNTDIGLLQNDDRFTSALKGTIGSGHPELFAELNAGVRPDGSKVESIWDRASRRLAEGATGDVRTLTSLAEDHKVFASVELPALLKNPNVTHINGVPLEAYQRIYASTPGDVSAKLSEVNKAVQASSRGLMSEMRWADAGDHVKGADRYRVDPGQLFEGTPYTEPPRVAANDVAFDMAKGPHPYESADQLARIEQGQSRLKLEVDELLSREAARAAAAGADDAPSRLRLPSPAVLKGLGYAGTAYGLYQGYGEFKDAIDSATSTRDLHVRAYESGADLAVRSGVSGTAAVAGGAVGGLGGSALAPGPGTVAGAVLGGGAAAYGAEKAYEDSRLQQWTRAVGRELGALSYDHISREGRLLGRLESLKEDLAESTDASERAEIQAELAAVGAEFKAEVDKNNAYYEGRGLIESQWQAMSTRFPDLDKDDVVDAYETRLEAGLKPADAVRAGYSDAVHEEVEARGLPYVPEARYGEYSDAALQAAWRRFSSEVAEGTREIDLLSVRGPEPSKIPLVGSMISEHHHEATLERLKTERWRDSGHVSAVEAEMQRRGLTPPRTERGVAPHTSLDASRPETRQVLADSRDAVAATACRGGLEWDRGLSATSYRVAALARANEMTCLNAFKVDGGEIRFAQTDGPQPKVASVPATQAANQGMAESAEALAQADARDADREAQAAAEEQQRTAAWQAEAESDRAVG